MKLKNVLLGIFMAGVTAQAAPRGDDIELKRTRKVVAPQIDFDTTREYANSQAALQMVMADVADYYKQRVGMSEPEAFAAVDKDYQNFKDEKFEAGTYLSAVKGKQAVYLDNEFIKREVDLLQKAGFKRRLYTEVTDVNGQSVEYIGYEIVAK